MKRAVIAGGSAAVVLAATLTTLHVRREREWSHGGDQVRVAVEAELATPATLARAAARLGVPAGEATTLVTADQVVVVRVTWSGADRGGSFQVLALDARVTPPKPLAADGGWSAGAPTGTNWSSGYAELAGHYDWLRGVAAADSMPTAAIGVPATADGSATAWFRPAGPGALPFRDPTREIIVALVKVDQAGEARWARPWEARGVGVG